MAIHDHMETRVSSTRQYRLNCGPACSRAVSLLYVYKTTNYKRKKKTLRQLQAWLALDPQRFRALLPASWDDLALVSGWVLIF